ncbi:PE family protein [Mycobacterium kansasii 732]|nr:PE family protein [Mycobacterium kansasii 732]
MAGMSFVLVEPDMMASAASDVARIGAAISAANDTAAATTTQLLAAGADEVSQGIAALFAAYARDYQAVSAQIAAYHDHIVRALGAGRRRTPAPRPPIARWCSRRRTGPAGAGRLF